jgi:hypothetical protein
MMTVEQVVTLYAALVEVIREHVHDPDTLHALSVGMSRVLNVEKDGSGGWYPWETSELLLSGNDDDSS